MRIEIVRDSCSADGAGFAGFAGVAAVEIVRDPHSVDDFNPRGEERQGLTKGGVVAEQGGGGGGGGGREIETQRCAC